jgi:small-conductance mechanosensitive channel
MANNGFIDVQTINAGTVLNAIAVIIIAYLLIWVITFLLTSLSERAGQHRIIVKMLIPIMKFSIYGLAVYVILSNILKLTSEQLIIFGGFLGAGIGFGLKDLFADVIGGIVITLERPYQVGDKIRMGDYYGEVIDIGIRATKLVTPDDNLVSAPNYLIFTQPVASSNAGKTEMMVVIDLFLDQSSDIALAMKILREAVVTSRYVYMTRNLPVTILVKDHPFYKRIRAKAYVNDLRYEFLVESDVTRRAWGVFSRHGIKAPDIDVIGAGATAIPD